MQRIRLFPLLFLILALLLSACPAPAPAPEAGDAAGEAEVAEPAAEEAGEKTLNLYLYQKPRVWSPTAAFHGPDQQVMGLIYQPLVGNDNEYNLIPRLAESWEISEDAKTITYNLRQNVVWSDGEPFTADDVRFTFEIIGNPATGSANVGRISEIAGADEFAAGEADSISGITVIDDHTIQFELNEANVDFVANLATTSSGWPYILPEHILGDVPAEEIDGHPFFLNPTVGLGPYNFVRYETDQFVELESNPNYYGGQPDPDRLFLKPLTTEVATAQLETGEIDLAQINATEIARFEDNPDVTVVSEVGPGIILMAPNLTNEYLQDERVRQAFLYGIDRQGIVDAVLQGRGEVVNHHILWAPAQDPEWEDYEYNPERARQLLEEAGWDFDRTLMLQWIPGTAYRDQTVNILQGQLADIGVQVELNPMEVAPLLDNMENRTFDFSFYGGGNYRAAPDASSVPLLCDNFYPNGGNNAHYCNEEVDALFAQGKAEVDPDARAEIYRQIGTILNQELPYITFYAPDAVYGVSSKLQNFKPHGDFTSMFWNADEWVVAE